ncbi:tegument protein pp71 [Saimiriine betaherpesvirus 4]|uniref:Tegument protein pp71 n=1 Tax=Saimiriine betaherpesvirus 4 TaxID=1535247 RepID=G8XSY7_9BETA|nr:tegument protein pp71 [Saimiriine betaherpesvirus 4]AEV80933.1 tegument protein pp71 [Saimiriine betaherpesvirus 4]
MSTATVSTAARRTPRNFNTLEHFSCQALRLIVTNPCHLPANEGKSVNTHLMVRVPKACVLCCAQEISSVHDAIQLRDLNIKGLTISQPPSTEDSTDEISLELYNFTKKKASPGQPLSVCVFAIPLARVPITGLHIFKTRQDENVSTAVTRAQTRAHIKRATFFWNVKINLKDIIWTRRQSPRLPRGQVFLTNFYFNTGQIPLTLVDAVDLLATSDNSTYIQKTETVGRGPLMKIYLQNFSAHPPTELFLHISVYSHQGEVVTRHNPEPFLSRHPENGFIVRSPQNVTLADTQTVTLHIDNAFESNHRYDAVFFPKDYAGLSMEGGFFPDRTAIQIKVTNLTLSEYHIDYLQDLGTIHLFPRGFFFPLPGKDKTRLCHLRLRAGIVPRQTVVSGLVSEFKPQSDSEEEESDDSLPTPTVLKEAKYFAASESEEEEEDAGEGPSSITRTTMTPSAEAITVVIPSWNVFMAVTNLPPMTCSISAPGIKATSYLKSDYSDVRTAADIRGTCDTIPEPPQAPPVIRTAPTSRSTARI